MVGDGTPKDFRVRLRREKQVFSLQKEGPEKQHNKDRIPFALFSGLTFLRLSGVRLFRVASPTKTQHGQWDLLESLRDTGLMVGNC